MGKLDNSETKIKQDTKAMPPWLERPCEPGKKWDQVLVWAQPCQNHTVTGWLVFLSPGLGVTYLLLLQKVWESPLGKWKRRETEKSCIVSEECDDIVSPWLYVTVMEEKSLRWEQAKGPESISPGWDQHSQHALSGHACYSQGPSRQGTGSLRRLWGPHLWRSAQPHWIKLWAAWSDISFCSKRSSSDKVEFIVNYSLILYCNNNCPDWKQTTTLYHVSHEKV